MAMAMASSVASAATNANVASSARTNSASGPPPASHA